MKDYCRLRISAINHVRSLFHDCNHLSDVLVEVQNKMGRASELHDEGKLGSAYELYMEVLQHGSQAK